MSERVEVDAATAVKLAEHLESIGQKGAAANVWLEICTAAPYDRAAREKLADLVFELKQSDHPLGTPSRSRFLAATMSRGFPIAKLQGAYFENLAALLKTREKRSRPGQVILGLGAGRCGSTTLTSAFAAAGDACATHEQHPFIYWEPQEEQVRFHFQRLRMLAGFHTVVFDAAHWWLNVLEPFFAEFPAGKAVALVRDAPACVESFLNIKGRGPGSVNHWATPDQAIWASNLWDPVYPSFPVPDGLLEQPEAAKAAMITRYVSQYNETVRALGEAFAGRLLVIATETLSDPTTMTRLSDFAGLSLTIPERRLNAKTAADGDQERYKL